MAGVLAIGLLDQVTPLALRASAAPKESFPSDRELIRVVEARLPPGTMVFQLPYVPFPEGSPVHDLEANDSLRAYLHSSTLRWSLPTMYGRSGDQFVRKVTEQPPEEILATLAATGFGGILVSRDGYADQAAAIETAFRAAIGAEPLISGDGRAGVLDSASRTKRLLPPRSAASSTACCARSSCRLLLGFLRAGVGTERQTFRWCDANRGDRRRTTRVQRVSVRR